MLRDGRTPMERPQFEDWTSKWAHWQAETSKRTDRAIRLISPKSKQREACRGDVETALIELEFVLTPLQPHLRRGTKAARLAANRLVKALHRVEVILKDKHLDPFACLFMSEPVRRWRDQFEKISKALPSTQPRLKSYSKVLAVSEAHTLMCKYSTAEQAKDTKRRSRFCQLAALLYGNPHADLHNQCRAALRKKRG